MNKATWIAISVLALAPASPAVSSTLPVPLAAQIRFKPAVTPPGRNKTFKVVVDVPERPLSGPKRK